MGCTDYTWLDSRIAATKATIEAYETAINTLVTGGISEYTLDTGQTRQRVTKLDIDRLQTALDRMYSRLQALTAQRHGCQIVVMPSW